VSSFFGPSCGSEIENVAEKLEEDVWKRGGAAEKMQVDA
jgi:hypothetical protein